MRLRTLTLCLAVLLAGTNLFAQAPAIRNVSLSQAEIDSIVARFTQNELEFREALTNYVFNRSATIQTIKRNSNIRPMPMLPNTVYKIPATRPV